MRWAEFPAGNLMTRNIPADQREVRIWRCGFEACFAGSTPGLSGRLYPELDLIFRQGDPDGSLEPDPEWEGLVSNRIVKF